MWENPLGMVFIDVDVALQPVFLADDWGGLLCTST